MPVTRENAQSKPNPMAADAAPATVPSGPANATTTLSARTAVLARPLQEKLGRVRAILVYKARCGDRT
jgi:hypothetical protein